MSHHSVVIAAGTYITVGFHAPAVIEH